MNVNTNPDRIDAGEEEYTFDLVRRGVRKVVTVDADSYEEAEEAVKDIRDRDFPGHDIEDHVGYSSADDAE